jgi:alkylation response protein AidB-like acyl-CoA dehydrogenase
MHWPGVEPRPLRQLSGSSEFNEVFLQEVRVPDASRLGDVGQGWQVSLTTLMSERVSIGGTVPPRGSGSIGHALELWRREERHDPVARDRLVKLWIDAECLRLNNIRLAERRAAGAPGPEGSMCKLLLASLNQGVYEFCVDLLGPAGMLFDYELGRKLSEGFFRQIEEPSLVLDASIEDAVTFGLLRARANSIEGGTSEVLRNILGERVLGLPRDIRTDGELPWREVPRN